MAVCDFCHAWVYTNLRVCKIMRCISVPIIVFVTLNQLYEMAWDEKFDCLSLYCMDLAYNIVSTQCFSPLIYWNTKMSCLCELTAYIVHAFFAKVHSVSRCVWFRKFFLVIDWFWIMATEWVGHKRMSPVCGMVGLIARGWFHEAYLNLSLTTMMMYIVGIWSALG